MPSQLSIPRITRVGSQLLRTACIRMRASECRASRTLCSRGPEARSSDYEHRSSQWREDAGETPAVQEGALCRRFESNVLLATFSSLRGPPMHTAFIPQIPIFCGYT